jgi:H+/Cl- antiporter ClcA
MERLQLSWILFMLIIGLVGAVAAYLSLWAPRRPRMPFEEKREAAGNEPIPPVLWMVYGIVAVGMIGYVVWAYLAKPSY